MLGLLGKGLPSPKPSGGGAGRPLSPKDKFVQRNKIGGSDAMAKEAYMPSGRPSKE